MSKSLAEPYGIDCEWYAFYIVGNKEFTCKRSLIKRRRTMKAPSISQPTKITENA